MLGPDADIVLVILKSDIIEFLEITRFVEVYIDCPSASFMI